MWELNNKQQQQQQQQMYKPPTPNPEKLNIADGF